METGNAIGAGLEIMVWKNRTKFFEEQGVNRDFWEEWGAAVSLFTKCKELARTFTGDSESFPRLSSSLMTLSSGHDGRI
jgi:hypothetical protein